MSDLKMQAKLEGESSSSERMEKMQILRFLGQAMYLAIERFMTIGEIIAEDHPEIKLEMYSCCKDARSAGKTIERLCEASCYDSVEYKGFTELYDYAPIVSASKSLLSSITRVLLLVDIVIVKQLLAAKKRLTKNLEKLESVVNFSEFVRAFSLFGKEIVELAFITSGQHNEIKEERRRAQLYSARQILERSISILLTSSKASLVHGDCALAKENRDTVFCQIRRAMDLIHFVAKESIFDNLWNPQDDEFTWYREPDKATVYSALRHFFQLMQSLQYKIYKNQGAKTIAANESIWSKNSGDFYKNNEVSICTSQSLLSSFELTELLLSALDNLLEKTYDFTDSAYTNHESREYILFLCDRCKLQFGDCLQKLYGIEKNMSPYLIDEEISNVLSAVKVLFKHLVLTVTNQMEELHRSIKFSIDLTSSLHNYAVKQDVACLQKSASQFYDYCDHIIDVCKFLRHIATTASLEIQVNFLAINLRIYGPQVLAAAKILLKYPSSSPANDNFCAFVDIWKWITSEIFSIAKQILELPDNKEEDKVKYNRLPESLDVTNEPNFEAVKPDQREEKAVDAKTEDSQNSKVLNDEKCGEEISDNDIIRRARNMSAMAFLMYQFTKGFGTLRTTQDLFTQAEYFAEEANRLYKILRQFSYQVPASENKKDLLNILDRVPTFVQTLQFTVKDHTVGRDATFVKVDHVIQETKNLMNLTNKVVAQCFECANKYKLDFTGLSGRLQAGSIPGDENSAGGIGDSKGTTNSSEGSM